MDGYLEVEQSSASQATTDDQEIFDNINGRMHGPMIGFMEKHFGNFQYTGQGASAAPSPDNFLQWFSTYASRELDGARGLWHISQDSIASGHESTKGNGSYIMIHSEEMPSARKIYLESEPVASRQDLVGTGTTCYRVRMSESRRWSSILKFKWRWARERPENELLELAKKNCVWGAVSLDYYKELERTANLRRGLRWGAQRKFTSLPSPETHRGVEEQRGKVDYNADGCSDYTEETSNFFQNRILTCTITSPAGRPLHTFQSLTELLQVFRDAVICHRSLYHDAKILHQDISSGNMIILDGQGEGKPKGILIDLDSAIQLTEGSKTERHTYRHDLESFLYVFLWTVISSHAENPPETSKLRRWSDGDWDELAVRKCLDMDQDSFRDILTEFTPEFYPLKSLAESLRQILFPLKDGVIWTGTHSSPEAVDKLYDGMMHAFEGAIASEGGR
ncbi:hypothetical protein ED733_008649 [Metarhizium rileyi]|uniref:Fungal-type protein kinase domain-containing protein n=1 Tax=Metarhizium rileyi (strain RCEF 4871) TaxID=1649241 RepID=A0A5C6GPW2_METRR|nr:hypothetical protein ED733_008649 [Metarhizium rileyi]